VGIEEEGQLQREVVHFEAGGYGGRHVGNGVGEGEAHLLRPPCNPPRDVIAGDGKSCSSAARDPAEGEQIRDEPHGGAGG